MLHLNHFVSKQMARLSAAMLLSGLLLISGGCANDAQTGALLGSAAGAGIGAIIGNNTGGHTATGAAIGAAAGAGGGYIIGNEMDKAKAEERYRRDHYSY